MSVAVPPANADVAVELPVERERFQSLRRLLRQPAAAVALTVLALLVLLVVLAPLVGRYDPTEVAPRDQLQGPSAMHWFGTDELGRDLYSRIVWGGRLALGIAVTATALAMLLGTLWGGIAAMRGGLIDEILMRIVDGIMSIPIILTALILVAAFGASVTSLALILGLLHVPVTARMVRSAILVERHTEYCVAATAAGASWMRLLRREILPNTTPTLLVQASLNAASIILTEAALSFVGLGIQPPDATWGTLLQQGYAKIYTAYWFVIFPGLFIFITIWALNVLADQLQVVLDPREAHR